MGDASAGGAFNPNNDYSITGTWAFPTVPSTASGTLVTTTGTQTLTNKTLTTPTITTPAVTAGTLSSPVITGATSTLLTEDVTATNVITAAESGTTYFLNSATEFVSTLPAPAAGLHFSFIVVAAPSGASYTVVTAASANIIKGQQHDAGGAAGDTGTADDTITFVDGQAVAGDRVDVISDGTYWYAYAFSKVAAGITFTQASA
jgi:hypothetical protein